MCGLILLGIAVHVLLLNLVAHTATSWRRCLCRLFLFVILAHINLFPSLQELVLLGYPNSIGRGRDVKTSGTELHNAS